MPEPRAMLPVLAFTVACGESARGEARLCASSFRHWHPDIPFLTIGDDGYLLLSGGQPPAWSGEIVSMRSLAGWFLSRHARRLIYLDSDLFVLGRLEKLIDGGADATTAWTSDYAGYTMGVPDCPRINSGVMASSDPTFWPTWTAAQYGVLLPALPHFYFNQLSLRILVQAGAVRGTIIDGQPGSPFYNVSIGDQPGDWRVENGAAFKGTEHTLVYHQAGEQKRGIDAAPAALQPLLHELTANSASSPQVDFPALWREDGAAFTDIIKQSFPRWPTLTLDAILAHQYVRTPGSYRSVAPAAWDRHRNLEGTNWQRIWNRDWHAYIYHALEAPVQAT